MPKPRTHSVSKHCDECGESSPVACRQCMHCKADFYSQTHEGGDYSPENLVLDDGGDGGAGGERRRSERGRKREKPDYYDSLEFENKRKAERQTSGSKGTPSKGALGIGKREKLQGRSPRLDSSPADSSERMQRRNKDKGSGKRHHSSSTSGRAILTYKKGGDRDDRDEEGVKRKKKKKKDRDGSGNSVGGKTAGTDSNSGKAGSKSNSSETGEGGCTGDGGNIIEEEIHMMDELMSAEKVIHCQISLMEINRKLCGVIGQPC